MTAQIYQLTTIKKDENIESYIQITEYQRLSLQGDTVLSYLTCIYGKVHPSNGYFNGNIIYNPLTRNMRLSVQTSNLEEINTFENWLLDIGEGKVGGLNDGEVNIDIPDDLLINDSFDSIGSLIEFVYPSSTVQSAKNPNFFQESAILTPKNEIVQ